VEGRRIATTWSLANAAGTTSGGAHLRRVRKVTVDDLLGERQRAVEVLADHLRGGARRQR
jgi:hypothetical protein